jgi:1-deoxy-D-xylulose-5-phosphate synthase
VSWSGVFADELIKIAGKRSDIVGITAAMAGPTGIEKLREKYPERVFDVGIAEQHAVTSAAGLALGGMHPVVAVYSTFLNRAFDQVLLDVAMHKLPVTFVLHRAGVTGPDGPSHYGIWDSSILGVVPGMSCAAPRDGQQAREQLREAVAVADAPTAVRLPTGNVPADLPAVERLGKGIGAVDVLHRDSTRDVLLVVVGAFAPMALQVAARAGEQGYGVTVVDPRWFRPVPERLLELAAGHRLVVTLEDGVRAGSFGTALTQALTDAGVRTPLRDVAVPVGFHPFGSRTEILADLGLTAQDVARQVVEWVASTEPHAVPVGPGNGNGNGARKRRAAR